MVRVKRPEYGSPVHLFVAVYLGESHQTPQTLAFSFVVAVEAPQTLIFNIISLSPHSHGEWTLPPPRCLLGDTEALKVMKRLTEDLFPRRWQVCNSYPTCFMPRFCLLNLSQPLLLNDLLKFNSLKNNCSFYSPQLHGTVDLYNPQLWSWPAHLSMLAPMCICGQQ